MSLIKRSVQFFAHCPHSGEIRPDPRWFQTSDWSRGCLMSARLLNRDSKHFGTKLCISNYVRVITHAYSWGSLVSGGLQKPVVKSMESIFFDRGRGLESLVGTTCAPTVGYYQHPVDTLTTIRFITLCLRDYNGNSSLRATFPWMTLIGVTRATYRST